MHLGGWPAACALVITAQAVVAQAPPAGGAPDERGPSPGGWVLVWAEEFDRDGPPDLRSWDCDTGFLMK
jgi:hypothetical protein